ncbi:MAG: DMT family transporter [Bacteroidota bacterium]
MRAPPVVWALVAVGLLAFGSSPILIRLAGDVPALTLAFWRTSAVTVVLAPLALGRGRAEIMSLTGREWGFILCAGGLLGLHFMAWIISVQLTSVASAAVLVTTSPLFIAILGALVLQETPGRRTVVAICVATAGAVLIALGEGRDSGAYPNPMLGNGIALGAAVLVSVYFLIGRAVRQRTSFVAYFWPLNAAAAVTCLLGCLVARAPLGLPLAAGALAVGMGLGPGLLGHGSFAYALRYIPAALIGLLSLAEPVLASTVALLVFREVPSPLAIVGMVTVLASIAAVVTGRRTEPAGDPRIDGDHEENSP